MFFWNSLACSMIQWMLAICSLVPLPFLNLAWNLEVHSSCTVEASLGEFWALFCYHVKLNILWHCLSLGLEWKLTFSSPSASADFSKFAGSLSAALSQYHLLLISLFTFMHWRRKWQPTPVFLSGESQGRGSLVGCCLWGCTDSDTTEAT